MVVCGNCGAGTPAGRHFCPRCGMALTEAGAEVDRADPMASPTVRQLWDTPASTPTAELAPTREQPRRSIAGPAPARLPVHAPGPLPVPAPGRFPTPTPNGRSRPTMGPGPLHPAPMILPHGQLPYPVPAGLQAPPYPGRLVPVYAPPRSKAAAAVLAFFFGWLGVHRFYTGDHGGGAAMLVLFFAGFVTFGLTWLVTAIWALVDFLVIVCGGFRDSYGRPLA